MPTSRTCVLDLEGLVSIPEGYTIVQTEAELWRAFGSDSPVWVRGPQQLVSWASRAFGGRGWSLETRSHEFETLLSQHPGMAPFVGELVKRAGPAARGSLLALGKAILAGLPLDDVGTPEHLLKLILWTSTAEFDEAEDSLRQALIDHWCNQLSGSTAECYRRVKVSLAKDLFVEWMSLGLTRRHKGWPSPPELSLDSLSPLTQTIQTAVNALLMGKDRSRILEFFASDVPRSIKRCATSNVITALQLNPTILTIDREFVASVGPFLTANESDAIEQYVPPPPPNGLPKSFIELPEWYRLQYLPYRKWSVATEDVAAANVLAALWPDFTRWYLDHLKTALNGGVGASTLAFQRVRELWDIAETHVVLLIILDGLLPGDEKQVVDTIRSRVPAWDVSESGHAATLVPTITEYCKTSLIYGCPPLFASKESSEIRSRKEAIQATVSATTTGKGFIVWVFNEPDWTYHSKSDSPGNTIYEVSKTVAGVATDISSLLADVPADASVKVVITSDHGRSLGGCPRELCIPNGGTSHDRVVHLTAPYSGDGAYIVENDQIVRLDESAFGVGEGTSLIPLRDCTFSESADGLAWYVHGGILPEETVVPWITMSRIGAKVELIGSATLEGVAGKACRLTMSISNSGLIDLMPTRANILPSDGPPIVVALSPSPLKPLSTESVVAEVHVGRDITVSARLTLEARKPSGELASFELPLTLALRTMQERTINLTEDFDI